MPAIPGGSRVFVGMVTLNRIYTKTGDKGETGLGDGTRRPKHALRIARLSARWTRPMPPSASPGCTPRARWTRMLARIQNDLFDLGADLCAPEDGKHGEGRLRIIDSQVERLEREIDAMNAES